MGRRNWLEVWDDVGQHWLRLDATPKGDPTVDEEEQEKDLEGKSGGDDPALRRAIPPTPSFHRAAKDDRRSELDWGG